MLFSVEPTEFVKRLDLATRITGKSALPETEYVYIVHSFKSVLIATNSLVSSVTTSMPVQESDDNEDGKFTVNAARLYKIVRGAEYKITFSIDGPDLVVVIGSSRWTLPLINADVSPTVFSEKHDEVHQFSVDDFMSALMRSKTVVSSDTSRWAYQQIAVRDGHLVASDGVQYLKYRVDEKTPDMQLPSSAIGDLLAIRAIPGSFKKFSYKKVDSAHVFYVNSTFYSIEESAFDFPVDDVVFRAAKIVCNKENTHFVFSDDFCDGLKAIDKISPDSLVITAEKDTLCFYAVGEDSSSAEVEVKSDGSILTANLRVPFDPLDKFFSKSHAAVNVCLAATNSAPTAPLYITTTDVEYVLYQAVA